MLASTSSASVRWLSLSKPTDVMGKCKETSFTDYSIYGENYNEISPQKSIVLYVSVAAGSEERALSCKEAQWTPFGLTM